MISREIRRIPLRAGKAAVDYFHSSFPAYPQLLQGENMADWIVDITTTVSGLK